MKKIAIITTHPIQYNGPWFRLLAERGKVTIKVFYTWGQLENSEKYDPDFGKKVAWDIFLLEGYEYTFVNNNAKEPGSHHFNGIDNPTLIKEIESWDPDALLVFGWSFKSHLRVLRYFKGKKTILFRGDSNLMDDPEGFSLKKLARRILLKWVYRHIDTALYVGEANRRYFEQMGLKDHQLVFAPHATDNIRFKKGAGLFRSTYDIPEDATVFLFSGKLEEKKNPLLLLEAFIVLNDPGSHLLFVGDGQLEKSLKKLLNEKDTTNQKRVHFAGFQNQLVMPSVYRSADIFVLPSKGPGETWGLSVNEAMASGCAVLVSDRCGCYPDLVKEGVNGHVFEHENIAQLTSLMKQMSSGRSELIRKKEASKEIIKDYSFSVICNAIEKVMNTLNQ